MENRTSILRCMPSPLARRLRGAPTEAEKRLWSRLRGKQMGGIRFRRQHPIGPYVVDFFCAEAKLVIEADGGQHAEDGPARTAWLEACGYRVIRFWNNDILSNTDGVLLLIIQALRDAGLDGVFFDTAPENPLPP